MFCNPENIQLAMTNLKFSIALAACQFFLLQPAAQGRVFRFIVYLVRVDGGCYVSCSGNSGI